MHKSVQAPVQAPEKISKPASPTQLRGADVAVCHHRRLAPVTYMYCFPTVLESEAGRVAVDAALACLATELGISGGERLRRGDGNSIVVEDVEPKHLWRAMDRAVPDWEDQRLFFAPVFI